MPMEPIKFQGILSTNHGNGPGQTTKGCSLRYQTTIITSSLMP